MDGWQRVLGFFFIIKNVWWFIIRTTSCCKDQQNPYMYKQCGWRFKNSYSLGFQLAVDIKDETFSITIGLPNVKIERERALMALRKAYCTLVCPCSSLALWILWSQKEGDPTPNIHKQEDEYESKSMQVISFKITEKISHSNIVCRNPLRGRRLRPLEYMRCDQKAAMVVINKFGFKHTQVILFSILLLFDHSLASIKHIIVWT